MIYDEHDNPKTEIALEIVITWVFAIGLVGLVLLVMSLLD